MSDEGGETVFVASSAAAAKKRPKKKKMVQVVEDEGAGAGADVQQQQPADAPGPAPNVAVAAEPEPMPAAAPAPAPAPIVEAPIAATPIAAPAPIVASSPPVVAAPVARDDSPPPARDDDDDFNPLAEAMGLSAASVAASARDEDDDLLARPMPRAPANSVVVEDPARSFTAAAPRAHTTKAKSSLAFAAGRSNNAASAGSAARARNNDDDDEFGFSSFAKPAARSSANGTGSSGSAAAAPAPVRDEFDDEISLDLGSLSSAQPSRSGFVATSSGYIDPKDLDTIRMAQQREAARNGRGGGGTAGSAGSSALPPGEDEFESEYAALAPLPVEKQSLAAAEKKPNQFDEFNDVWEDVDNSSATAAAPAAPVRKTLKASNAQKKVEKPNAKEEAALAREAERARILAEEAAAKERAAREEEKGLSNPLLAKLGMGPTTILAQYDRDPSDPAPPAAAPASAASAGAGTGASAAAAAPARAGKPVSKVRAEQMQLESNDAVLAASAGPAPAAPINVVDALASAHAASSGTDAAAEMEQWGAVNDLREKQLAAARAEAERAAAAAARGKAMGIKAAEEITRDTPIHYDAALRALTHGPSEASLAASAAAAAVAALDPSAPAAAPLSHAELLASLRPKIQIHDFRGLGFARSAKFKMLGAPRLPTPELEAQRDNVFLMAAMKLDWSVLDHERMVLSLYRSLTNDPLAPPTFGAHWTLIGFQGNDPSTDLRGAGLFSLIQLLYLSKHYKSLMHKIYALSCDERQNFPFCTLSTNLTGMVLQSLRSCKIYGEAGRRGSVYETVNLLYAAAFWEMYLQWKNKQATIGDWNEIRESAFSHRWQQHRQHRRTVSLCSVSSLCVLCADASSTKFCTHPRRF